MDKQFEKWMGVKEGLHNSGRMLKISEGDIWWCGVGENVGVEINGKSEFFSRPVLVAKKFSRHSFLAIPLTSQKHDGDWYASFMFQEKQQFAVLVQARIMSVFRLYSRIGTIPESDRSKVMSALKKLLFK